jgi:F-type H+-transporting ATPase subunit delta
MAELATIARPYAEALFEAAGESAPALLDPLAAIAAVAAQPALRQFADNPKVAADQVYDLVLAVLGSAPPPRLANLLRTVIDNGRLAALPAIADQFKVLVNARSGSSDAVVYSAYPIEGDALANVVDLLQRRFGRRLNARVEVDPELIGGIRVVVGDEVLDASVKSRLEQMKIALTA